MSESPKAKATTPAAGTDFIRQIVIGDLKSGKHTSVCTRFPPEPNGYLHIGHAKSICLNFGIARDFGGMCNLRFDDTNPVKEDVEYVESIQEDVRWLGLRLEGQAALRLGLLRPALRIRRRVDQEGKGVRLSPQRRGDARLSRHAHRARTNSPYRDRSVEENLELFEQMRRGELEEGHVRPACEDRHGLAEHQSCATPPCTASRKRTTIAPVTSGASTRCTTSRTGSPTPSKASRTPSARWSSRITARCTTGFSTTSTSPATRSRSSSRA